MPLLINMCSKVGVRASREKQCQLVLIYGGDYANVGPYIHVHKGWCSEWMNMHTKEFLERGHWMECFLVNFVFMICAPFSWCEPSTRFDRLASGSMRFIRVSSAYVRVLFSFYQLPSRLKRFYRVQSASIIWWVSLPSATIKLWKLLWSHFDRGSVNFTRFPSL